MAEPAGGRAHALAGSLTSGGAGAHAAGQAGQAIALATRAAFVSGLHQILWVAAVGAAPGCAINRG